jgi:hypothetical protein
VFASATILQKPPTRRKRDSYVERFGSVVGRKIIADVKGCLLESFLPYSEAPMKSHRYDQLLNAVDYV